MLSFKLLSMALILGASALVFSMHGQGGGVFYTPVQVFFGVDFHLAAARSQLFIVLTALSSTIIFGRAGRIDWPMAIVLEMAAGTGGFLGGLCAYRFSPDLLMVFLGSVVLLAAVSMLKNYGGNGREVASNSAPWRWHRELGGQRYVVNLLAGLPLWFVIGVMSGLTGTAGGFLKIPLMVLLFGMSIEIAFGCASFMVMLTAASGFAGHIAASSLDWPSTLIPAVLVAVGAQIGPRITLRSDPRVLQRRFAYVLCVLAAVIFYRNWSS